MDGGNAQAPFGREPAIPRIAIPTKLNYARQTARRLQVRPTPEGTHKYQKYDGQPKQIRDPIGHLAWALPQEATPGVTWLELFALFEFVGNSFEQ